MAEEEQTGQAPQATPPAGVSNTDQASEKSVPYERFKEVNDRLKKLEDEKVKSAAASQAAEDERLAKQNEWQGLAEKRKAKVDELQKAHETLSERLQRFEAIVARQLDEVKSWPEEVKALDPGEEADLLDRLSWIERSRPLVAKLTATAAAPGNHRGPKALGPAGSANKPVVTPVYDVKRNF